MAKVLVEKDVHFCGTWRQRSVITDKFIKLISDQFLDKPSRPATFILTQKGLTLHVVSSDQAAARNVTHEIELSRIHDVTVNVFNPLCLMAVYAEPQGVILGVMVCRCRNPADAVEVRSAFRDYRNYIKYNEASRWSQVASKNWTLRPRSDSGSASDISQNGHNQNLAQSNGSAGPPSPGLGDSNRGMQKERLNSDDDNDVFLLGGYLVEYEKDKVSREEIEVDGHPAWNVAVQTEPSDTESDRESIVSSSSLQSLKDELHLLSNEMKAIKFLLETSTGISAEQYFRREGARENRKYVRVQLPNEERKDKVVYDVRNTISPPPDFRAANTEYQNGTDSFYLEQMDQEKTTPLVDNENGESKAANESEPKEKEKSIRFALDENKDDDDDDENFDLRSIGQQTDEGSPRRGKFIKRFRPATLQNNPYRDKMASRLRYNSSTSSSGSTSPLSPGATSMYRPIENVYSAYTHGFKNRRNQVIVLPNRTPTSPPGRAGQGGVTPTGHPGYGSMSKKMASPP